jgi:glycosyltransferase involved in cell wall biosynthesis
VSLVTLYSAVDVMIVPSLQENLSNAIMESLACATPVVGFDIGGNSDMIEHKKNGYLAKPFDSNDLAHGIEWVLNADNYDELCHNAREKVLREFDSVVVAKKYVELYEEVLNG